MTTTPAVAKRAAFHEAGHAVVAWSQGLRMQVVTIDPLGGVNPEGLPATGYVTLTKASWARLHQARSPWAEVRLHLAGAAALELFSVEAGTVVQHEDGSRTMALGDGYDRAAALALLARYHNIPVPSAVGGGPPTMSTGQPTPGAAIQQWLLSGRRCDARPLLERPHYRAAVHALARALLARRWLTGRDASGIIGRAVLAAKKGAAAAV
jgi:hypothetical protein